jgi:hypothetical protein
MQFIKLSYIDNVLSGRYSRGDDDIFIEADSTLGAFSIKLPDLKSFALRTFFVKNIGTNTVTMLSDLGQPINSVGTLSLNVLSGACECLLSNGIDKWYSL